MNEWNHFTQSLFYSSDTGLLLDWSGMGLDETFFTQMREKLRQALEAMEGLEAGEIANPDEGRMVGHYWLRAPALAPTADIKDEIERCLEQVKRFAADIHAGRIRSGAGRPFRSVLVAGIGGSSLGPVFVDRALASPDDKMKLFFLDNTDPDGMDAVFRAVDPAETLLIVISKSGGTIETRNCMEEARRFYAAHGLDLAKYAVCVTGAGSKLDALAAAQGWLARFPMWDWVGGRTSVMSAVGLLPLALKGANIDALLAGAAACDALGRNRDVRKNPAALLALSWYRATGGQGGTTMVVLPYRDRLALFAKYLQQLLMESLGKELDLDGNTVHQGLAVLGNKGSSDQHSYVQQLVAGPDNVFVVFTQVLRDRELPSGKVGESSTSGDYLNAFMLGTKKALEAHGKRTLTITVPDVDAYQVGQLIALFERAVGIYAQLIHINAYHQPAVEFGKRAADGLIAAKNAAVAVLRQSGRPMTAPEIARAANTPAEDVFRLLLHMAGSGEGVILTPAEPFTDSAFQAVTE